MLPTFRFACVLWIVCGGAMLAGCGGTQHTAENTWSDEPPSSEDSTSPEAKTLDAPAVPEPLDKKTKPKQPVSVRSDMGLSPSAATTSCPCLRVAVGPPSDPVFQWFAGAPKTEPDALAIAVTAAGIDCPGGEPDENQRHPSISAIDIDGNDIIVEIEELPLGAPQAMGALLPPPGPGGSVYVRAREGRGVYARAGGRCKVR